MKYSSEAILPDWFLELTESEQERFVTHALTRKTHGPWTFIKDDGSRLEIYESYTLTDTTSDIATDPNRDLA